MSRQVWQRLGIASTADVAEIKRAYARRLKETDVDADPRAFIALREARDRALALARRDENDEPDDWIAATDTETAGAALVSEPAPPPDSQCDRSAAQAEDEARRRVFADIDALLFPSEDTPLDEDRLVALTRAVLADPAMDNIATAAAVRDWFAHVAAAAVPRSDAILPLLIEAFHWDETHGHWDESRAVAAIAERHRAHLFLDYIAQPSHPYHRAYRELVSPRDALGVDRWFVSNSVAHLLRVIRERYPSAEERLDPHRVALWDEHCSTTVERGLRAAFVLFWILYLASRFLPLVAGPR